MNKLQFVLLACAAIVIVMIYLLVVTPTSRGWCVKQGYDGSTRGICYKMVNGTIHAREYMEIGLGKFAFIELEGYSG